MITGKNGAWQEFVLSYDKSSEFLNFKDPWGQKSSTRRDAAGDLPMVPHLACWTGAHRARTSYPPDVEPDSEMVWTSWAECTWGEMNPLNTAGAIKTINLEPDEDQEESGKNGMCRP